MGCTYSTPVPQYGDLSVYHETSGPYLGQSAKAMPLEATKKEGKIKLGEPIHLVLPSKLDPKTPAALFLRPEIQDKMYAKPHKFSERYKIRSSSGEPFADGIEIEVSISNEQGLYNGKGEMMAVLVNEYNKRRQPTGRKFIYGTSPLIDSVCRGRKKLHPWAKIDTRTKDEQDYYVLMPWDGEGYRSVLYKALPVGSRCTDFKSYMIQDVRTKKVAAYIKPSEKPGFAELTIAPGMDPCLMLCFKTMIDEMKKGNNPFAKAGRGLIGIQGMAGMTSKAQDKAENTLAMSELLLSLVS